MPHLVGEPERKKSHIEAERFDQDHECHAGRDARESPRREGFVEDRLQQQQRT